MRLRGHCSPPIEWSSGPATATAPALVGSKRHYTACTEMESGLPCRTSCALLRALRLSDEIQPVWTHLGFEDKLTKDGITDKVEIDV